MSDLTKNNSQVNERRLQKLRSLNLLDTEPQDSFDRLTRLASKVLNVPVAIVSLVDIDRQFFMSQAGLGEPHASLRETPLSHSFCKHVVETNDALIVEDAREHPLVQDNPAIAELNVIAYAGIPLTIDGATLGAFCAIDTQPKQWTEQDISILHDLAALALTGIKRRIERIQHQETIDRLEASETRFRAITETASDGILVLDVQQNIEYCNKRAATIFGYTVQELLGKPISLLTAEISQNPQQGLPFWDFLNRRPSATWQGLRFLGKQKDGSEIPIEVSFGQFTEGGQYLSTVIVRDVTYQAFIEEELRRNIARYLQILDAIPDFVFVKNSSSQLIWANKAFLEYYGMSLEEMVGIVDADHVDSTTTQSYIEDDMKVFETGEMVVILEEPIVRHDKTVRKFMTTKTPIFNEQGTVILLVGISRDVTDAKNLERYLTETLEQKQELIELKTNFVSTVSHEFRTPLSVIMASADIISKYYERLTDEKRLSKVETIKEQVHRLTNLMNDILIVSRAESARLAFNPQWTDVNTLVASIVEETRLGYEDTQVGIEVIYADEHHSQFLDSDLFRHIFQNLLTNAVKYSRPNTDVTVWLKCTEESLTLTIADEGIGIPAGSRENMFQSFHRAHNVGTIQGTGLGLSIVKSAVDAHSGTIDFKSVENEGTTFTVTLPTSKPEINEG